MMLKAKVIHPAAETCGDCHQAAATPHPQQGKKTFKLAEGGAALCRMCHSPEAPRKYPHEPVKNGECTSCHDPHESGEAKLLVQPRERLCSACHSDKTNMKYMHGPAAVGDCTGCHMPHGSDNKALLVKSGNDLCFTCHAAIQGDMKKKVVHDAVKDGCTGCHNPHGSSVRKLLSAEGETLCFQCHSEIGGKIGKSKSVHAPVKTEKACASCHAPHASDGEKLLQKSGKDLCIGCHKNVLKKKETVLHGPVREGKCTPCHDPHGSPNARLLVKAFPTELYVPYTDTAYALCFSCHNRDLLRFPDTSFATGFRDGERNLHFLHVNNKDKGRNCKVCHAMHASELPKLVPVKVLFGKWDLPLKFVKTDTGGSCAPGCHRKFVYDRKTPGKASEPEKPKEPAKPKPK
jgi:predicted CXXCH cytochrome family protein